MNWEENEWSELPLCEIEVLALMELGNYEYLWVSE